MERDEDIIISYREGDKSAFKKLVDKYTTPIYNFVFHLTQKEDAPDITQEVFIKVWKNINRFDTEKASFKTWIFSIAKNTTIDYLRKKKNLLFSQINNEEEDFTFEERILDTNDLPDEAFEKIENKAMLEKVLENINPQYKEVVILHYQEDMTFEEIGEILGKSTNTIKSQHRRALIEMRKKMHPN